MRTRRCVCTRASQRSTRSPNVQDDAPRPLTTTLSYSHSRARSAETLDAVVNDREDVVVTRSGHDPVAIVSAADYESLKETAYLLQGPANARRLINSIERLESGAGAEHELAG